jgi:hypothetical protein
MIATNQHFLPKLDALNSFYILAVDICQPRIEIYQLIY